MRPGILRTSGVRQAKKGAAPRRWRGGPPKRCDEPTATSTPNSPGAFSSVSASRSVAQHARACTAKVSSIKFFVSKSESLSPSELVDLHSGGHLPPEWETLLYRKEKETFPFDP